MKQTGFFRWHRKGFDTEAFNTSDRLVLFQLLISEASFEDEFATIRGNEIYLKRGQLAQTHQGILDLFLQTPMGKSSKINRKTIAATLKHFEKHKMIIVESQGAFTVITICKYNTYNPIPNSEKSVGKKSAKNGQNLGKVSAELHSANKESEKSCGKLNKEISAESRQSLGITSAESRQEALPSIEELKNKRNKEYINPPLSPLSGEDGISSPSTEKETSQVLFSDPPTVAAMAKTKSPPKSRKRSRRDDYMDAVAKACGMDLSNQTYAKRIGKVVRHLMEVEAAPGAIPVFVEQFWKKEWKKKGFPGPELFEKHSANIKALSPKKNESIENAYRHEMAMLREVMPYEFDEDGNYIGG